MTGNEAIEAKLLEGVELLNQILIRRVQEMVLIAGNRLEQPRVRERFDQEHAKMQQWHAEMIAQIESTLLATVNRLN